MDGQEATQSEPSSDPAWNPRQKIPWWIPYSLLNFDQVPLRLDELTKMPPLLLQMTLACQNDRLAHAFVISGFTGSGSASASASAAWAAQIIFRLIWTVGPVGPT